MFTLSLLLYLFFRLTRPRYHLKDDHLRVRVPLYGRKIPLSSVDLERAAVVDVQAEPAQHPKRFRGYNGLRLTGLRIGWFRRQCGERALLCWVRSAQVLHLPVQCPQRGDYTLILSAEDPAQMLQTLRTPAPSEQHFQAAPIPWRSLLRRPDPAAPWR